MSHTHAVVWLDSREAHVLEFTATDVERQGIQAHSAFRKTRHERGNVGSRHFHSDHDYYDGILKALAQAAEWLITGPAATKNEFANYVETHFPQLKSRLIGVETVDHPTDGELVDHARRFFKAADRMIPGKQGRRGAGCR